MRDKYENNKTQQKNKKQRACGQDSCPTLAITLHNTGRSHNCHLSQHGTPTQLSLARHKGHPRNGRSSSLASDCHTTRENCSWGGGAPCFLGFSLPTLLPPCPRQKSLTWGDMGRKREQAVRAQPFKFAITWESFTARDCYSPARIDVSLWLLPMVGRGRRAREANFSKCDARDHLTVCK